MRKMQETLHFSVAFS